MTSDSIMEKTPRTDRRASNSEHYMIKQTMENVYRRIVKNPLPIVRDRKGNPRTFTGVDLIRF